MAEQLPIHVGEEKNLSLAERILSNPAYESLQRIVTAVSVFDESIIRFWSEFVNGESPDEDIISVISHETSGIFAINLGLKMGVKGIMHLREPEAVIDMVSIAAESIDFLPVGNVRLARLIKQLKAAKHVTKAVRGQKLVMLHDSLEDQAVSRIMKKYTWVMIALFGGLPAISKFDDLDYSNPMDFAREMGFNVGLIALSKWFQSGVREEINSTYTRLLEESKTRIEQIGKDHPELQGLLDRALSKGGNEVTVLVEALASTLVDAKHLINPVGEDFKLDADGAIETIERDAVVMFTDIRNFTPLDEKLGKDTHSFLNVNYYFWAMQIIQKYGGKVANMMGDGMMVYFTDSDEMDKCTAAVLCAEDLSKLTNSLAELFKAYGYGDDEKSHWTGIGLATGEVKIGDLISKNRNALESSDQVKSVHNDVVKMVKAQFPELKPETGEGSVASVEVIGGAANRAARIEAQCKGFGADILMEQSVRDGLHPGLAKKFDDVGSANLKGVSAKASLFGVRRA